MVSIQRCAIAIGWLWLSVKDGAWPFGVPLIRDQRGRKSSETNLLTAEKVHAGVSKELRGTHEGKKTYGKGFFVDGVKLETIFLSCVFFLFFFFFCAVFTVFGPKKKKKWQK